jgi:hypothetical protein
MADGDVVRRITISATGEGIDSTASSLTGLGDAAQGATNSISDYALAVAGIGGATIGVLAGLRAFVDYVGQQSQALVDIASHADLANMSTKEFQATLFAAESKGVKDSDFFSGFEKITSDITAASQGVTEFGRLFEANGLKIKDSNGQLISTKTALAGIMTLMQNATPAV